MIAEMLLDGHLQVHACFPSVKNHHGVDFVILEQVFSKSDMFDFARILVFTAIFAASQYVD